SKNLTRSENTPSGLGTPGILSNDYKLCPYPCCCFTIFPRVSAVSGQETQINDARVLP
ncbi:hypothetical protein BaRGS_00033642, partial [Batillaria attramentaria]